MQDVLICCTRCKTLKQASKFSKNIATKNGLCPDCKECRKRFYAANKEKLKDYHKKRYADKKEHIKQKTKEYKLRNKKRSSDLVKAWIANNRDKNREWRRNYVKRRRKEDPLFKLRTSIRSRIMRALKLSKFKKTGTIVGYLGAEYVAVRRHIESLFQEGMTWENHGSWHIDHIKPLGLARSYEEIKHLFHYTNLQPLWAKDNQLKGVRNAA